MQSKTGACSTPSLPEAGESIKDYILNGRPDSDAPEIFLREKAPFVPMASGVGIGYMFDCYCKKAGIDRKPFDGKGFHGLRRRLARNMLVSGTPSPLLRRFSDTRTLTLPNSICRWTART